MDQTLLLNASFEPVTIIPWQRAMTLFFKGRVEIVSTYEEDLRAVTFIFKMPSVVRLLRYVKIRRQEHVPFTRANIYARDGYECQYCGVQFKSHDLTFDHVIPATQGGMKAWENIVSACVECNARKGGRTPEEAGMALLRKPRRPSSLQALRVTIGVHRAPTAWRDWLYWHIELTE